MHVLVLQDCARKRLGGLLLKTKGTQKKDPKQHMKMSWMIDSSETNLAEQISWAMPISMPLNFCKTAHEAMTWQEHHKICAQLVLRFTDFEVLRRAMAGTLLAWVWQVFSHRLQLADDLRVTMSMSSVTRKTLTNKTGPWLHGELLMLKNCSAQHLTMKRAICRI